MTNDQGLQIHANSAAIFSKEAEEGLELLFEKINSNPVMRDYFNDALTKLESGIKNSSSHIEELREKLGVGNE